MKEDTAIVILTYSERITIQSRQDVPLLRYLDTIEMVFIPRAVCEIDWVVAFHSELVQWMSQPVTYGVHRKDGEIGRLLATRPPHPSLIGRILSSRKHGIKSKSRVLPNVTLHRLAG